MTFNLNAKPIETIKVWTDGGCWPNPGGPGGWAWTDQRGKECFGRMSNSTNNKMELMAVLSAIVHRYEKGKCLLIHSDSQYIVKGCKSWVWKWLRNGWKTATGEPVKNRNMWERFVKEAHGKYLKFKWVPGHRGVRGNERADELASRARKNRELEGTFELIGFKLKEKVIE